MGCAYSAPNPVQAALAPPIQKGHPLLGQLVEVLRAEYEMRQPQSVGRWLDTVNEAEFARAGCNKRSRRKSRRLWHQRARGRAYARTHAPCTCLWIP